MPVRNETWPIEALPHEEALTPVVESFLVEGLEFDFSQSGVKQLYDRIDQLAEEATKANLLHLVSNLLGELDCLAICTSGFVEGSEEKPPSTSS